MSKLCVAVDKIYNGTAAFYTEMDRPEWRFTDSPALHTAYKVSVCSVFAFGTSVYIGWKSVFG